MDPYDSDSSDLEDAGDYAETSVLLGFPTTEATEDTISHLGGWPTWPDDASPPPGNFANCRVCNKPMLLLLQLNGDLPEHFPNDERRLYIFGCPRKSCSRKGGSIRAFRAVRKLRTESSSRQKANKRDNASISNQNTPKQDLGVALFGATSSSSGLSTSSNPFSIPSASSTVTSNPFATLSPSSYPANPADICQPSPYEKPQTLSSDVNGLSRTFAEKARLSSTVAPVVTDQPLPWPPQSAFPAPYPRYYFEAEYETLSHSPTPNIPANPATQYFDDEERGQSGSAADAKETFESKLDISFLRFSTRLSHNPEQALRYEFRGSPLLSSITDAIGKLFPYNHHREILTGRVGASNLANRIPRCEHCGRERVFELQLVPHAISVLEEDREGIGLGKDDAGMEWVTIIMAVCAGNCALEQIGVTRWYEEWIGVQLEETR